MWPEATSVSASRVSWVGIVSFRGTVALVVHVKTVVAAMPCWTASCVNVHKASLGQHARWGRNLGSVNYTVKQVFDKLHQLCPKSLFSSLKVQNDPCSPNPCQNKAQCHNLMGDFYCSCPDDYEGKTCSQLKDHCKTNRCEGNLLDLERYYLWLLWQLI